MKDSIQWLDRRALLLLHEESLADHGGLSGFRDEGLFDSALVRPQQILNYEPDATLARLAAAYAFGITRNHPFSDGNKRTAYLALDMFCRLNGWAVKTSQLDVLNTMLALAAGNLMEEVLVLWISKHLIRT